MWRGFECGDDHELIYVCGHRFDNATGVGPFKYIPSRLTCGHNTGVIGCLKNHLVACHQGRQVRTQMTAYGFSDRLADSIDGNDFDLFSKARNDASDLFLAESPGFEKVLQMHFVP